MQSSVIAAAAIYVAIGLYHLYVCIRLAMSGLPGARRYFLVAPFTVLSWPVFQWCVRRDMSNVNDAVLMAAFVVVTLLCLGAFYAI